MTGAEVRRLDQGSLSHIGSMYLLAKSETGDDRQAFIRTCREAILEGYIPAACWVSAAMLAAGRPTHVVAFQHKDSAAYITVIVGGVGITCELDVMYNPEDGKPGWRLIDEPGREAYVKWARQQSSGSTEQASAC